MLTAWECSLENINGAVCGQKICGRRRRRCPRRSPVRRFICLCHYRRKPDLNGHTPVMYAIICAIGALISMVGNLAASAIKRNKEIKDYGTLIPGHGGILDRFDSVLFTAPFIYFLASVLI